MHREQKGFTLVELLVAMAITAIIGSVLVSVITQVFIIPNAASARLTALMQVDQAVDAITRDALQAQTPLGTTQVYFADMQWLDFGTTNLNEVKYTIDAKGTLWRAYYYKKTLVSTAVVAKNIDATKSSCSLTVNVLSGYTMSLNIVSTVGGARPASETRQVQISPRPD